MKIVKIERSFETCTEGGWYGYHIILADPIDEDLIMALSALGQLYYLKRLQRPFFTVRSKSFLVRGIMGDHIIKAGFENKEAPEMASICRIMELPLRD